jgi:hypothetical protein
MMINDRNFRETVTMFEKKPTAYSAPDEIALENQKVLDARLLLASVEGDSENMIAALKAGADVHADNDWALRWASNYGHTEVVKLLLDAGADVHAQDNGALRSASVRGHTEVVKILEAAMAAPARPGFAAKEKAPAP